MVAKSEKGSLKSSKAKTPAASSLLSMDTINELADSIDCIGKESMPKITTMTLKSGEANRSRLPQHSRATMCAHATSPTSCPAAFATRASSCAAAVASAAAASSVFASTSC